MKKLYVNKINVKRGKGDSISNIQFELNSLQALLMYLRIYGQQAANNEDNTLQVLGAQMLEAADLFGKYISKLNFTLKNESYTIDYIVTVKISEDKNTIEQTVLNTLKYEAVQTVIEEFIIKPLQADALQNQPKKPHKQSRAYAKTVAKIVGRDTSQPSLFSLPMEELQKAIETQKKTETGLPFKDKLSKNVGVLGNILLQYHQDFNFEKDKDGYTSITNLSALAEELHTDTKELKYYLLYLGGYQYPSITYYEEEKEIGLQLAKLFEVEFIYKRKGKDEIIDKNNLIQSDTIQLLINTPIKRIRIKPSQQFLKDLEGKKGQALGYVNVNDNFVALCLGLSDYAYKLLSYSYTNKPTYTITESKLLENLGLTAAMKKQGPTKLRQQLEAAFKELEKEGHFKKYTLPFNTDYKIPAGAEDKYTWLYGDKFINHQDFKEKVAVEYVDFNDKNIPLETRIKAYKAYLSKKRPYTPIHLQNAANQHFKEELDAAKK